MPKSKSLSGKKNFFYWGVYALLISLRFSFTFTLSPGYIFPDEYFQSIELATHDIYTNSCNLLTWEFKPVGHGPVRSRSCIYPLAHMPIQVAQLLNPAVDDTQISGDDMIKRILVPTRLFTTFLSFIPDAFIYYISGKLENTQEHQVPVALLLYSSMAYGGLFYNTRTFSNVWETALVCVFCYLSLRSSFLNIIIEAAVGVFGLFLRPTFPMFVLPFMLLQLYKILRSPNRVTFLVFGIPAVFLSSYAVGAFLAFFDTIYYSGNRLPGLNDLVVAPSRFLKYNSAPETLAQHGLHPWYHYFFIHWPLILTPLITLLVLIPPRRQGFNDALRYTVWLSVVLPTLLLTLCFHKETRFVIPSLPFAACLASLRVRKLKSFLVIWVVYQAGLVVFWGYLHQAGILPFMRSLPAGDANNVSLNIFYKTYMPPRFPFGVPSAPYISVPAECRELAPFEGDSCQRVVDFAGRSQTELFTFLDCLRNHVSPNMIVRVVSYFEFNSGTKRSC